jgi:hypothetical protein
MGIQSQRYAVLDFGRLGRFERADAVRVGVSQPLLSLLSAKSANKFQQISRKSFASRRSLTAKSCRPIGNKKKPSTHAPTSHRTHTQAHTASCLRQLPSMLFSSRSISGIRNNKPVNHISGARVETRRFQAMHRLDSTCAAPPRRGVRRDTPLPWNRSPAVSAIA